MQEPLWGIDLGGTKIEGVVLPSLQHTQPLARLRLNTEAHQGYEHILQQIARVVKLLQEKSGLVPKRVGMGTPGILDPLHHVIKNSNTVALIGKPLQKDIEAHTSCSFTLANDANCFALAETHWGIARERYADARVIFGIIMGTGVGGGIVIDSKIWNGKHGIAGEWGHIVLDKDGERCYCGKKGCVETFLSGPATERFYESLTGRKLPLKEIAGLEKSGDAAAIETIERLCSYFGKAVSIITNLLDPDLIIVGGGVGQLDTLYSKGIETLKQYIFNDRLDVPIVKPLLGDSAGVFGAAALSALSRSYELG